METKNFLGYKCISLENGIVELLVTHSIGPRILSLRFKDGENLLAELPEQYLQDTHRQGGEQTIAPDDLPLEFVMNHLRLKQGFTMDVFHDATGLNVDALEPGLSINCRQHLLLERDNRYFCSEKGWDFLDTVLQNFMT